MAALIWAVAAQAAPRDVAWHDLPDPALQGFDDPFAALPAYQLNELATLAWLRGWLDQSGLSDEARARFAAQEKDLTESLALDGVAADPLLARQGEITAKRAAAGRGTNPDLTGAEIRIAGFVIPAPAQADGTFSAYLVPQSGMCSHVPAPPPNQMIRLRLRDNWQPDLHEPVLITGALTPEASDRGVFILDGPVRMQAAFTLDVADIERLFDAAPASGIHD